MGSRLWTVPLAVMPKGVEHWKKTAIRRLIKLVPLAVMPKGVEHTWMPRSACIGPSPSRSP